MNNIITVAVVQHACSQNYQSNMENSIRGIQEACDRSANIILLPELNSLPYFCVNEDIRNFDLAETIPGPTTETLGKLAKEHSVIIITSIFEKRAKGLYHNTAVVIDQDGSLAGTYRKMHIPDDPGFYEKFYFTPGDLGFQPISTTLGKLGVLVCWDQWFPEAARLMALAGAEMLFYPSAIGWDLEDSSEEQDRQINAWTTIQRSHAIANNLPVISSNRIGHETDPSNRAKGTKFWGSSFITGQQGETLASAPVDDPAVIIAEIDTDRTDTVRRIWPYFRDRRIDAYEKILHRCTDK